MKKILSVFTFLAASFFLQAQNSPELRFIKITDNNLSALLMFNNINEAEFNSVKTKLESNPAITVIPEFFETKKTGNISFKAKNLTINDFESSLINAGILEVNYNFKLIATGAISDNYNNTERTEVRNIRRN